MPSYSKVREGKKNERAIVKPSHQVCDGDYASPRYVYVNRDGGLPAAWTGSEVWGPANTTSWARLNCGRGNYCPLGSAAPLPCPILIPPNAGAQQVQGPAFMVETAACLAHCFFHQSSTGLTSSC